MGRDDAMVLILGLPWAGVGARGSGLCTPRGRGGSAAGSEGPRRPGDSAGMGLSTIMRGARPSAEPRLWYAGLGGLVGSTRPSMHEESVKRGRVYQACMSAGWVQQAVAKVILRYRGCGEGHTTVGWGSQGR